MLIKNISNKYIKKLQKDSLFFKRDFKIKVYVFHKEKIKNKDLCQKRND